MEKGQILYSSWGYEQTNIDFYEVVKVTENWITLRQIESREEADGGFMTTKATPIPGKYVGEPFRRKLHSDGWFRINSYSGCSLWDGQPMSASHYG